MDKLFVRERGSTGYKELYLKNDSKTLAQLVAGIQKSLKNPSQILAILRDDGSRIDSDLDVCFISSGHPLEVVFANKFYWIISEDQRKEWTQEFISMVGNAQTRITGEQARAAFTASRIALSDLAAIWDLADMDKDSHLNLVEYLLAKFLIYARQQGQTIPTPVPLTLIESITQIQQQQITRSPLASQVKKAKRKSINNNSVTNHNNDHTKNNLAWTITSKKFQAYNVLWSEYNQGGFVTGQIALDLFSRSGIDRKTLAKIWTLADLNHDSQLDAVEFKVALHLIANQLKGIDVPESVPVDLLNSIRANNKQSAVISGSGHASISPTSITSPVSVSPPTISPTSISANIGGNSASPNTVLSGGVVGVGGVGGSPLSLPAGVPLANNYQAWQLYPQPNVPLPAQPFNIGNWNFINEGKPDLIAGIAAGIRARVVADAAPPIPTTTPAQLVDNAEKELTGVIKIDPTLVMRGTLLGGGAFGNVWKGTVNNEVVAIKDMSYRSEKEVDMWKREVQLLSALQHANYLVKIKGYCITPDHLTIVMEFMDGGSLYDIIHKQKNVTWSMLQKVRILRHIASAIESIHKLNIIHRDIKSMNILMDRQGVAKLADLGCSRVVRSETMTKGVGSPLWMAPEVANSSTYSFPCDIFGYGVVIYEVFNEKLPEYDLANRRVVIAPECIGYTIIKECTRTNPDRRPTASLIINSLDLLVTTFTTTVARVVKKTYTGDQQIDLPHESDVRAWYHLLLAYDRETFDVLLSSGLHGQH